MNDKNKDLITEESKNANRENFSDKKEPVIDDTTSDNVNNDVSSKNTSKKIILLGGCALAIGLGALSLVTMTKNNNSSEFENFIIKDSESVNLEFTIKEGDSERNRTAQEMREFYTPQGEEFIKTLYPESSDSDLALLTIGKSITNELSNIEFTTADNTKVSLKNLKGKKIILDFALTTCPSCQEELTYLSTKATNENEVLLHIFPRSNTEEIKSTYKDLNIKFDNTKIISSTGMNNLTFEDFNITHVPTKIYINEEGIVTYITTNTLSDEEVYNLHYDRAFGDGEKVLDYLKTN